MIFLMLDTCVWISFLERADLQGPLRSLEELVADKVVTLLTTREILDEMRGDRRKQIRQAGAEKGMLDRISKRLAGNDTTGLAEACRMMKANPDLCDRVDRIEEAMVHVDDLLLRCKVVEDSADVNAKVLGRLADGLAPFHREDKKDVRRCVNDAMIIEKFAKAASEIKDGDDYVFVSLNRTDYATATDADEHHSHYANIFGPGCHFTKKIDHIIHDVAEAAATGHLQRKKGHSNRKSWDEIQVEIASVDEHHWLHRHFARKRDITDGKCRLHPGRSFFAPLRPPRIGMVSWQEDLVTAEGKLAKNPGLPRETGPYQAGFAAGALMALKWVLGDERSPARVMTCVPPEPREDPEIPGEVQAA